MVPPALRKIFGNLCAGKIPWPLFLHGKAGRGKTCAALTLLDRVPWSCWETVETLVNRILAKDESTWRYMGESPLVIVDELGIRSSNSDLEYVAVKRLADLREYRPTVWISNHEPDSVRELYDDRIFSRICCGTWFCLNGTDRRMPTRKG